MGTDYVIEKYFGFKIPDNITEEDYEILEKLYKISEITKAEYGEYIFFNSTCINVESGRLHNFIKIRLGERIYPDKYIKEISKEEYNKNKEIYEIPNNSMKFLKQLSFVPEYKYAWISY